MTMHGWLITAMFGAVLAFPALADTTPKRGGTLTYLIPADAPPSFDGHKESTFATVHAFAPFYSLLVRINPDNPSSTTDIVCDLCSEMPKPTASGKVVAADRDGEGDRRSAAPATSPMSCSSGTPPWARAAAAASSGLAPGASR